MQIVINIDKKLYEGIERRDGDLETEYVCDELMKAVDNGTLLPKGHGRLIDADELKQVINSFECYDQVLDAPTIVEADRSEET